MKLAKHFGKDPVLILCRTRPSHLKLCARMSSNVAKLLPMVICERTNKRINEQTSERMNETILDQKPFYLPPGMMSERAVCRRMLNEELTIANLNKSRVQSVILE